MGRDKNHFDFDSLHSLCRPDRDWPCIFHDTAGKSVTSNRILAFPLIRMLDLSFLEVVIVVCTCVYECVGATTDRIVLSATDSSVSADVNDPGSIARRKAEQCTDEENYLR